MARIKAPIPGQVSDLITGPISPFIEDVSLLGSYIFRGKIVADRFTRGFEKETVNGGPNAFETSGRSKLATENDERQTRIRNNREANYSLPLRSSSEYQEETPKTITDDVLNQSFIDTVSIVDIDFKDKHNGTRGYKSISLPFIPRELSYEPTSKFVGIATMGRNNPFYGFTGSEDTLSFDIDWFSNQEDRKDVINSCRWVEALSKSDAYEETPHRIKLVWGRDELLFRDQIWIVTSAPYSLTDFVKNYRKSKEDPIISVGLLPQQAIQKITLKRVTDFNLSSEQIISKLN